MNDKNTPTLKDSLHGYQRYAVDFVKYHKNSALFLEMGLGKSAIVLEALYEANPSDNVLIIAPKTIAKCTWTNEIKKWNMPFRVQSLIVNENGRQLKPSEKEEIYQNIPTRKDPWVYLINRDQIVKLVDYFTSCHRTWPFGICVIDESQSFKDAKTQRFKALKRVRPQIHNMILLSGSPAPNSLLEIWSQIYLLDGGKRLGQYYGKFRDTYFYPTGHTVDNIPINWKPKAGAEDTIYNKIGDIAISMKNKYIKLPDLTYNDIYMDMEPSAMKKYKTFAKNAELELNDNVDVYAVNAAVKANKLSQMASGAIYNESGSHEYTVIHTQKLEMCEHIIENTDDNVIIAYHFQSEKQELMKYFKDKRDPKTEKPYSIVYFDGNPETEKAWNEGQYRIMLLQPASGGAGVNLQKGGHTLIWYTLPWSLENYEQTNARIYRQGQTEHTVIHRLLMNKTIDPQIAKALESKDVSQNRLLQAIEATLKDAGIQTGSTYKQRVDVKNEAKDPDQTNNIEAVPAEPARVQPKSRPKHIDLTTYGQ